MYWVSCSGLLIDGHVTKEWSEIQSVPSNSLLLHEIGAALTPAALVISVSSKWLQHFFESKADVKLQDYNRPPASNRE